MWAGRVATGHSNFSRFFARGLLSCFSLTWSCSLCLAEEITASSCSLTTLGCFPEWYLFGSVQRYISFTDICVLSHIAFECCTHFVKYGANLHQTYIDQFRNLVKEHTYCQSERNFSSLALLVSFPTDLIYVLVISSPDGMTDIWSEDMVEPRLYSISLVDTDKLLLDSPGSVSSYRQKPALILLTSSAQWKTGFIDNYVRAICTIENARLKLWLTAMYPTFNSLQPTKLRCSDITSSPA